MAYGVSWSLVGDDGIFLETDVFPEIFETYEETVAFILGQIDMAPSFGYDRAQRFWWLRGAGRSALQTRFRIMGCSTQGLRSMKACASF